VDLIGEAERERTVICGLPIGEVIEGLFLGELERDVRTVTFWESFSFTGD